MMRHTFCVYIHVRLDPCWNHSLRVKDIVLIFACVRANDQRAAIVKEQSPCLVSKWDLEGILNHLQRNGA